MSLYSNLKYIAQNLVFERQSHVIGQTIQLKWKSRKVETTLQQHFESLFNFDIELEPNNYRKLAIQKYGYLDLTFEIKGIQKEITKDVFKVLRDEGVVEKVNHNDLKMREDDRETLSFMLEDDIQKMKDGRLELKIFAKVTGDFITGHEQFQKRKMIFRNRFPRNPKEATFVVTDACITNLSGVWFNKYFYW